MWELRKKHSRGVWKAVSWNRPSSHQWGVRAENGGKVGKKQRMLGQDKMQEQMRCACPPEMLMEPE